jgi:hypothetical protein
LPFLTVRKLNFKRFKNDKERLEEQGMMLGRKVNGFGKIFLPQFFFSQNTIIFSTSTKVSFLIILLKTKIMTRSSSKKFFLQNLFS